MKINTLVYSWVYSLQNGSVSFSELQDENKSEQ